MADGVFTYSAPAGDYYIEVIKTGYITAEEMVTVTVGGTTTENFAMRMDAPCIVAAPASLLAVIVPPATNAERTLTLTNYGAAAGDYSIIEKASGESVHRSLAGDRQPDPGSQL